MALQDLTPQLRTRLNRTEKAAGWFVMAAVLLLIFGFSYYLYHTARNKGWFITKIQYQTGVNNAAGLKVGDPVKLMGKDAGVITRLEPNDPKDWYGITVFFEIKDPNFGYIWTDSRVKIQSDFLGNRYLEVTKGLDGVATVIRNTNGVVAGVLNRDYLKQQQKKLEDEQLELKKKLEAEQQAQKQQGLTNAPDSEVKIKTGDEILAELRETAATHEDEFYVSTDKSGAYWLDPDETPALNDRLEKVARQVEQALPNVLAFTNQLAVVLNNGVALTSNLNVVALSAQPAMSNLAALSEQLKGSGALGDWAMGTNFTQQVDTNLTALFESFGTTLENLAQITSNLNAQVQVNTNMLGSISQAVVDTDDLVQGLKRHWLLRSAFKKKTPPK